MRTKVRILLKNPDFSSLEKIRLIQSEPERASSILLIIKVSEEVGSDALILKKDLKKEEKICYQNFLILVSLTFFQCGR